MTTIPPTPPSTCDHESKFPARHNGEPVCVECNASPTIESRLASSDDTLTATSPILLASHPSNEMLADAWDEGWKALEMWTGEDADAVNPYRKNASNE